MENPSKETLDNWHKDPNNWKWGLFYYNKEDNRLLVDKRNPNLGATINFAHPKSYLFLIGMACFFGFIIYMISLNGN
ncbi:DUF5808 domain-containing protein [Flavobacterium sp.]|jgi:uncharacterized membrane protein|uniref:DUF5808 domain-containing protein n=1 Tax=Flavobacterium sp. TaxID=239 RepID=UPI0037BEA9FA